MMRLPILILAAVAGAAVPALAQPSATPLPAPVCERRDVPLAGGVGRASVVAFTGSVYGERVCALVANLAFDRFSATLGPPAGDDSIVTAPVAPGTGATLLARSSGLVLGAAGASSDADAVAVGPFVVAPGGQFVSFAGDTSELPRVVLAYAGSRVLLIRTSAITLLDFAHALREQPDLFGSDAAERAVVLASGPSATMQVRTADGVLGAAVAANRALLIKQR